MHKKRNSFKHLFYIVLAILAISPSVGFATDLPGIPNGWSDGYVYANGIRIHYYHGVPAPGKPVILAIHGGSDTGLSWASVAKELQGEYDIYMLDTRGHGLSDPYNGSEDRNTLLKDVMEAAGKLNIEKPILMGHSMGGGIVIRLGDEYPNFARAIIVVDAGINMPKFDAKSISVKQPQPSSDPLAIASPGNDTPEILVKQNNYSFDDLVAKAHRENPRWSMMDCEYWAVSIKQFHGPYSKEIWQVAFNSMMNDNALARIQLPMVILKADAPAEIREAHQKEASVMKNGKLIHIDNSGHNVQRDQPKKAAEVIRNFLSKLNLSAGNLQKPTPVRTEYGLVQGIVEPGLTVYRGVPFAAPPVGNLRWKAPQPATSWDGVRDATKFAPSAFQHSNRLNVSEDCLYLNVWSPAKQADEKLPVLVWIYGGGFISGGTDSAGENGEYLARKGVVVVSINYRVGPLGFFAHPELSAESPNHVSGNYGLLDQIAGLKWVKQNIAAFGGDPNRVTIFGESAGGISVSMLCASPLAKGLFHGAISESGGSFGAIGSGKFFGENMTSIANAEKRGEAYMRELGASSIADLRQLPPDKLPIGFNSGVSWPNVDGWVIADDQYKLYSTGQYNDVPVIVGYNSDEGLFFAREKTAGEFTTNAHQRFGPYADKLLDAYPPGKTVVSRSARNLIRDAAFGWHTWSWARLQSHTGKSKVFYYYFDQHPKWDPNSPKADQGTAHGPEVSYVFQVLNDLRVPGESELRPVDFAISDMISTYWVNFAKYGDPNGSGLPKWPQFKEKNGKVMYFNEKVYPGSVPDVKGLEIMDSYFEWRRGQKDDSSTK